MKQYAIVEATFAPKRTDDLQNDAAACIGQRYLWLASGIVESGEYAGEWRMDFYGQPLGTYDDRRFVWVPLSDLADVVEVE